MSARVRTVRGMPNPGVEPRRTSRAAAASRWATRKENENGLVA